MTSGPSKELLGDVMTFLDMLDIDLSSLFIFIFVSFSWPLNSRLSVSAKWCARMCQGSCGDICCIIFIFYDDFCLIKDVAHFCLSSRSSGWIKLTQLIMR